MKKVMVSCKKWGDRGNGKGFGWKYSKSPKFICTRPVNIQITTSLPERFCDEKDRQTSVYKQKGDTILRPTNDGFQMF